MAQAMLRFDDYEVRVYSGAVHSPGWIRHIRGDEWRDNLGKLVEPPEVNFGGKYYVSAHSCGAGCRYYTMTDLSSGLETDVLKNFATAEPPPRTREGYSYFTHLVTRYNSKLLVAQYQVYLRNGEECRERAFIIDKGKLTPITDTRRVCGHY